MRQHLTAVQAARRICGGGVTGDQIGSSTVTFEPGQVTGGDYAFSIGTAGSTTLVLQTILLPLLCADKPSRITLDGGTHNPFAPPFDFLERAYLPLVNRMGPNLRASLERPGFFPAGGGRIVVEIEPAPRLRGFELLERGDLRRRHARAAVANLPGSIGERELAVIRKRLAWRDEELDIDMVTSSRGPGNIVTLTMTFDHVTEVFTGFGETRRSAEAVATHAVQACERYLRRSAPVGEYLTDQLMLPMALAGEGAFSSIGLSRHAETHVELIRRFLDVPINISAGPGHTTIITCVKT